MIVVFGGAIDMQLDCGLIMVHWHVFNIPPPKDYLIEEQDHGSCTPIYMQISSVVLKSIIVGSCKARSVKPSFSACVWICPLVFPRSLRGS